MTAPFDPTSYTPPQKKWCACHQDYVDEYECDGREVGKLMKCDREHVGEAE